jgi:hypothetical protein
MHLEANRPSRSNRRVATRAALTLLLSCALKASIIHAQSTATSTTAPSNEREWRRAAESDLAFAFAALYDNHPGVRDTFFRYFPARLDAARDSARAMLPRVTDAPSYRVVLRRFTNLLQDGHAGIWTEEPVVSQSWPGFVTAWRGDALLVYASVSGEPTAGSEVVACDGRPVKQLVLENVFSFRGRQDEAGEWWALAPMAFVDTRNPLVERPRRCQFRRGSSTVEHELRWRARDSTAAAWLRASVAGEVGPVSLTEPRPGLFWFRLPTFSPDSAERRAYRELAAAAEVLRPRLQQADAIVLDLRGNLGGSSEWAQSAARSIWGEERVNRAVRQFYAPVEIWWRSSAGNLGFIEASVRMFRQQGRASVA